MAVARCRGCQRQDDLTNGTIVDLTIHDNDIATRFPGLPCPDGQLQQTIALPSHPSMMTIVYPFNDSTGRVSHPHSSILGCEDELWCFLLGDVIGLPLSGSACTVMVSVSLGRSVE
ncbi:hypothetical protein VTJ83DRAFT_5011 [Remersonia thermophila]|uniref:Uncharacterized protein n=1 Tax=Remersonia thermophila TaxID=72144 RepID=A0ABR4DDN0_9PEZI